MLKIPTKLHLFCQYKAEKPRISYEIRGFSCQFDLIFVKYRLIQCAVLMRHDRGADSVAGDINGSTRHIEDTVDSCYEGDSL